MVYFTNWAFVGLKVAKQIYYTRWLMLKFKQARGSVAKERNMLRRMRAHVVPKRYVSKSVQLVFFKHHHAKMGCFQEVSKN